MKSSELGFASTMVGTVRVCCSKVVGPVGHCHSQSAPNSGLCSRPNKSLNSNFADLQYLPKGAVCLLLHALQFLTAWSEEIMRKQEKILRVDGEVCAIVALCPPVVLNPLIYVCSYI